MKYIWIRTASIKSFFSLGRFVSLQIRTILCMFVFRFKFGYCPLSSNFWMVSNSVRQDLASLNIVWIFLESQTWALLVPISLGQILLVPLSFGPFLLDNSYLTQSHLSQSHFARFYQAQSCLAQSHSAQSQSNSANITSPNLTQPNLTWLNITRPNLTWPMSPQLSPI